MSGGKSTVPVGGVDGIADPNRHSRGKQGKQPAQGVLAAGGNGDLIGEYGAGQPLILMGQRGLEKRIPSGGPVAPHPGGGGHFGGGGTQGGGRHRRQRLGDIPDTQRDEPGQRMGGAIVSNGLVDPAKQIVRGAGQGGVQFRHTGASSHSPRKT